MVVVVVVVLFLFLGFSGGRGGAVMYIGMLLYKRKFTVLTQTPRHNRHGIAKAFRMCWTYHN